MFTRECDRKIKENRTNHETLTKTLYMMRKVKDEITFYTSAARMVDTFTQEAPFNAFFAFSQQVTGAPFNEVMEMLQRSAQRGKRS